MNRYFFNKPYKHKNIGLSQLEKYLMILRNSGYDGGFIIIENAVTKEFVQFQKHIDSKGNITLNSSFFPVDWNMKYFGAIKEYLEEQDFEYEIIEDEDGKESIEIFCNDDLLLCVKLVKDINTKVFGMNKDGMLFSIWFENVCEKDVLITTK